MPDASPSPAARRTAPVTGNGHRPHDKHSPEQPRRGPLPGVTTAGQAGQTTTARAQEWPTVSVVIPTLNEGGNIGPVLDRIPAFVREVVLVDGGSRDGTVREALRRRPDTLVVHEPRPGKGVALRSGFRAATSDIIVMLDADGSMDPDEIGRLVFLLGDGYRLVKGSRFLIGGGSTDLTPLRRLGNLGLRWLINVRYRAAMTDLCYGYCAFFRSELEALALTADGFEIEAELVSRALDAGLRVTEVPSFEQPRRSGRSNLRPFRDGERILGVLLAASTRRRGSRTGVATPGGALNSDVAGHG